VNRIFLHKKISKSKNGEHSKMAEKDVNEEATAEESKQEAVGKNAEGENAAAKAEEKSEGKAKAEKKSESAEEKLKKELAEQTALAEDYKRRLYLVTAEYDNYRKRVANISTQKYLDGKADVIEKFFPIGDNLERALSVASDEKTKQGLSMVIKAYEKIMEDENITSFDPTGEEFNALTSTAVVALPAEEGDTSGTVKQTFAKGYKRGDKILRFAQVAVVKSDEE